MAGGLGDSRRRYLGGHVLLRVGGPCGLKRLKRSEVVALCDGAEMRMSPRTNQPESSSRSPLFGLLILVPFGCGPAQPCTDGDCNADGDEETLTDLPCGGADLKNDDDNCGECGNKCEVSFADTPYPAGGCKDGECGTQWGLCTPSSAHNRYETCNDVCSLYELGCKPRACGGRTGLLFTSFAFSPGCFPADGSAPRVISEMEGSCEEQIPWLEDSEIPDGDVLEVMCCCE